MRIVLPRLHSRTPLVARAVVASSSAGHADVEDHALRELHLACERAQAAYSNDPAPGGTLITDAVTDAQCVVHPAPEDGGSMCVAFRGSSTSQDWSINLLVPQVPAIGAPGGCNVHLGFLLQWLSLREEVLEAVAGADSVVLCGHSLGGGVATVACCDSGFRGKALRVMTFGAPRVGNRAFVEHAASAAAHTRVVHDMDPVPILPLHRTGYRHVPVPWLELTRGGALRTVEAEPTLWQQVRKRLLPALRFNVGVRDHDVAKYASRLARHCEGGCEEPVVITAERGRLSFLARTIFRLFR